uniref:EGF-like domain-containing protein n=1 Tax=Homalodisca liturata TaxID=320908 RepID=A0A1B6HG28_9HEMI
MRVITVFCVFLICYRADGVDILVAYDDGVESFNSSEHSFRSLVLPSAPVSAVDYHYQRKEAFAAWDNRIYRFPLFNNDSSRSFSPTSVANISLCWSFAVDWVHDHVFWPDCGIDAAIMMSDLDGGNITVIVPLSQNRPIWIPDIAIDPYRGLLFWISDGSVLSCGLDGREITTVAKLAFTEAVNLVLDMVAKRIYLLSRNKSFNGIYYLEYHSSEPLLIHDEVDGKIWSFSVYKSQLYLCYDSSNGTYLTTRSVADHATSKQQLTNLSKTVWHMKVIDPELQTPPEIDQCTAKGCSHHCVVQESLALCSCPRNFHLGRDQRICEIIQVKNDTFVSVLEGIACVVFILFAAGILMCLCDKVWSNVHPTVVRVTSPSNSFKRRIYKGSDLSENLI